jgi:hypothetical protein
MQASWQLPLQTIPKILRFFAETDLSGDRLSELVINPSIALLGFQVQELTGGGVSIYGQYFGF